MDKITALTVAEAQNREMMDLIKVSLRDPSISPEKLNGLYDFRQRLVHDANQIEANAAFARAVKNMPVIKKNGIIEYKDGKGSIPYATFEDIQAAIRPIYEAEGFVMNFDSDVLENMWTKWTAIATHSNGIQFRASIPVPLDTSGGKQNIQGAGSSAQYGKRYAAGALWNLRFEGEDDDGLKGGMQLIDLEKVKIINQLLAETKADVTDFLRYMGVAEVVNIERRDYTKAVNALMQKKKQMGKK